MANKSFLKKDKAQVWIETAIYTLIGLAVIALLLSIITPQIEKTKDKGVVAQTITALNILHNKILEVEQSPGRVGIVELKIGKGKLEIDSREDLIKYVLENTRLEVSQPGQEIKEGNVILKTKKTGSRYEITLTMLYNNSLNITYQEGEKLKTLTASQSLYRLQMENVGDNPPGQKLHIDFDVL